MSLVALGARFGVRVNDASALGPLLASLPPSRPASSPVVERLFSVRIAPPPSRPGLRQYHLLYENHVRMARTLELSELLDALARQVRLFVGERARRRVCIHAGVVGWRGKAIVLPGRSMSGKSTLVAELVRAGASYYSDELAVFDERGRVHASAKAISLRTPGGDGTQIDVAPETFGRVGTRPLPLGLVAVTRFRPGARWRPRALSQGEAVISLVDNALAVRRSPGRVLRVLAQASSGARAFRSARGEAREVAERLLALCEIESEAVPRE